MPTSPPPGRFRVVEQGRRLVVIDTATGEAATRSPATPLSPPPLRRHGSERGAFEGRRTITTSPLYDNKGPRTVELDARARASLNQLKIGAAFALAALIAMAIFEPMMLILVPLIAMQKQARAGLRTAATPWIDRYDTGSRAG